jgi:hypothetical protein
VAIKIPASYRRGDFFATIFVTADLANVTLAHYKGAAGVVRIFRGTACFQRQIS